MYSCDPGEVGMEARAAFARRMVTGTHTRITGRTVSHKNQAGWEIVSFRPVLLSHSSTGAVCKVRDEKWGGRCRGMPKRVMYRENR